MAYCIKCGAMLAENAKFCHECGCNVNGNTVDNSQRRQEFAGKIIKCPNCGEILKSFEANCPACGHELRDARTSNAVKEFAQKLEEIETVCRTGKTKGIFTERRIRKNIFDQKVNLIQCFAVPNTKEDMMEFMILATSCLDVGAYSDSNAKSAKKQMNEAWLSKVRQTYDKAKASFPTDHAFVVIKELYDKCNKEIRKEKRKANIKNALLFLLPILFWSAILIPTYISYKSTISNETKRLERIVAETEAALNNGEYRYALDLADSIDYQLSEASDEKKWDIERDFWVEKVLKEAADNGVELEYTPSEDIDNTKKKSDTSTEK